MSRFGLSPFFPRWFDDLERSHSLFDQFFGQNLMDEDLLPPPSMLPYYYAQHPSSQAIGQYPGHGAGGHGHRGAGHHRHREGGQVGPLRPTFDRHRSGLSMVTNDKNQFKVNLDVHQFKPEEVVVKTVDNYVIIEGKHEEKEDEHGYIQRHFVRKYLLPEGVKPEKVTSTLSVDGVLTIQAPKQPQIEAGGERVVEIAHSPYPAIHPAAGAGAKPPTKEKETGMNGVGDSNKMEKMEA